MGKLFKQFDLISFSLGWGQFDLLSNRQRLQQQPPPPPLGKDVPPLATGPSLATH